MIVLGIDPGAATGLAVVDTKTQKVLWSKTVYGGWKARDKIEFGISDAFRYLYKETSTAPDEAKVLIQVPIAKKMAFFKRYDKKGKEIDTKAQVAKNAIVAGFCVGYCHSYTSDVVCIESQSQRGKGMKMTPELFKLAHPEAGTTSGHVRDAAVMALGYTNLEKE